jgi:hypothetical protein
MKNNIDVYVKEWKMGIEHLGNAFIEMHPHAFDDTHGLDDVARILAEYIIRT